MSFGAAKIHETSQEHVDEIEKEEQRMKSWGEPGGGNGWEYSEWYKLSKTDRLTLVVEYWYKGVQAALDRGEELKFELFLENLND